MKKVKDHLGNTFESIIDMCEHYNISYPIYYARIGFGYTKEQALTGAVKHRHAPTDHLGNMYNSVTDMCKHYNISRSGYYSLLQKGYTKEQIFSVSRSPYSLKKIARTYGIIYQRLYRYCVVNKLSPEQCLNDIANIKDILTARKRKKTISVIINGIEFNTFKDIANYFGVSPSTISAYFSLYRDKAIDYLLKGPYLEIKKLGYERAHNFAEDHGCSVSTITYYYAKTGSLQKALELIDLKMTVSQADPLKHATVTDHLGNKYKDMATMAAAYKIELFLLKKRLSKGLTLKQALTMAVR